jgi:hypothetical protein
MRMVTDSSWAGRPSGLVSRRVLPGSAGKAGKPAGLKSGARRPDHGALDILGGSDDCFPGVGGLSPGLLASSLTGAVRIDRLSSSCSRPCSIPAERPPAATPPGPTATS